MLVPVESRVGLAPSPRPSSSYRSPERPPNQSDTFPFQKKKHCRSATDNYSPAVPHDLDREPISGENPIVNWKYGHEEKCAMSGDPVQPTVVWWKGCAIIWDGAGIGAVCNTIQHFIHPSMPLLVSSISSFILLYSVRYRVWGLPGKNKRTNRNGWLSQLGLGRGTGYWGYRTVR